MKTTLKDFGKITTVALLLPVMAAGIIWSYIEAAFLCGRAWGLGHNERTKTTTEKKST